jgi:hypothetical protein
LAELQTLRNLKSFGGALTRIAVLSPILKGAELVTVPFALKRLPFELSLDAFDSLALIDLWELSGPNGLIEGLNACQPTLPLSGIQTEVG